MVFFIFSLYFISEVVWILDFINKHYYEVPLCMSLLGFGMGTMLANFHMCGIMLLFRAMILQSAREKCEECLCVLGALCLVCQDLVSCYSYFFKKRFYFLFDLNSLQ